MTCTFLVWIFNETKVPSKGRCVHKIFYLSLSHSRLWRFCLHESKHVRKGRKYYRTFQSLIVDQKKKQYLCFGVSGWRKNFSPRWVENNFFKSFECLTNKAVFHLNSFVQHSSSFKVPYYLHLSSWWRQWKI